MSKDKNDNSSNQTGKDAQQTNAGGNSQTREGSVKGNTLSTYEKPPPPPPKEKTISILII